MMVSDEMVEKYKKGTKPEHIATQAEVDEIKSLLFETINQTKVDYDNKIFKNYQEYTTIDRLYVLKMPKMPWLSMIFMKGSHWNYDEYQKVYLGAISRYSFQSFSFL